jgi:hypothetical protein
MVCHIDKPLRLGSYFCSLRLTRFFVSALGSSSIILIRSHKNNAIVFNVLVSAITNTKYYSVQSISY